MIELPEVTETNSSLSVQIETGDYLWDAAKNSVKFVVYGGLLE